MLNSLRNEKIQLILIIFITFLAYSNIFNNQLVISDSYITSWPEIRDISNIPKVFVGLSPDIFNHAPFYRPIEWVIYMVYYPFFGENPLGYHFHSITIHILSIIFIYFIALRITKNQIISTTAALVFAIHPLQTESVAYISVSMDSTGKMLFLASFLLYLKANEKFPKFSKLFLVSQIIAFLAYLNYEVSLILPILIIWYDFCFVSEDFFKLFKKKFLKIYLPYFFLAFIYLFLRFIIAHVSNPYRYLNDSIYLTALAMVKSFGVYLLVLLYPAKLLMNRQISPGVYSQINEFMKSEDIANQSIFDASFLLSFFVLLLLFIIGFYSFKKYRIISFAMGWFFISLLPVANIIPIGVINADRYLYVGVFGYALILGFILETLIFKKRLLKAAFLRKGVLLFFLILITFYAYRTWVRNLDYRNDRTLWEAEVKQAPQSPQANYAIAGYYLDDGNTKKAIEHYQNVADFNFEFPTLYEKLGILYLIEGNKSKAIENFSQALKLEPDLLQTRLTLNKLGVKSKLKSNNPLLNDWVEFKYSNKVSFYYPENWLIEKKGNLVKISDPRSNFKIKIEESLELSPDKFLNDQSYQKDQVLVAQGMAKIPNFNQAYVKKFNDSSLQFLLIRDENSLLISINHSDLQSTMKLFDVFLGSIIVDNN